MPKSTATPPRRPLMPQLLLVAMLAACTSSSQVAATEPPRTDAERAVALLDLAQILARPNPSADSQWKADLVRSYEKVYGPIDTVPATWDAAVRRTLACDALNEPRCVATSLTALDRLGGPTAAPIDALAEVSQFRASSPSIEQRISGARQRLEAFATQATPHPKVDELAPPQAVASAPVTNEVTLPTTERQVTVNPFTEHLSLILGLGGAALFFGGAGVAYGVATNAAQRRAAAAEAERSATIERLSEQARLALEQRERAERDASLAREQLASQVRAEQMAPPAPAPAAPASSGHSVGDQLQASVLAAGAGAPETMEEPAEAVQLPDDPRYLPARRLFDALHCAERDVEPFLELMEDAETNPLMKGHVDVILSWHGVVKKARNDLEAAFAKLGWPREMPATTEPASAAEAMKRLIEHAAFLSAVLTEQKKESAAVFHWSRQIPGAALQLYWPIRTMQHQQLLKQEPVIAITYDPLTAGQKPVPAPRPALAPKPSESKAPALEPKIEKRDHESIQRDALLAAIGSAR